MFSALMFVSPSSKLARRQAWFSPSTGDRHAPSHGPADRPTDGASLTPAIALTPALAL